MNADQRRERMRRKNETGVKIDHGSDRLSPAAKANAERMLAEVPEDTRDLTQRIAGDPLPSRSALAKRGAR